MKPSVFQAQFIDLEPKQRGLLWEYYHLTTSALSTSEEEEFDRLARIWELAENDPVLSKWLSLIDFLYTDVPFAYETDDDDRRAYLSEYLELLADEQPEKNKVDLPERFDEDAMCVGSREGYCTLICPDGSGYILRPSKEMNSMNADERENWSCDRCKKNLTEHRISCTETPAR